MNFSHRDILTIFYGFIALVGLALLIFSWFVWKQSQLAPEPLSYLIAATVLLIMGLVLIMFGLETYIFRDDPDVWL